MRRVSFGASLWCVRGHIPIRHADSRGMRLPDELSALLGRVGVRELRLRRSNEITGVQLARSAVPDLALDARTSRDVVLRVESCGTRVAPSAITRGRAHVALLGASDHQLWARELQRD